jgi:predicted metalloprotease
MHWKTGRRSENIEDRRAQSGGSPSSLGRGLRVGGGLGGVVLVVAMLLLGVDPSVLLTETSPGLSTGAPSGQSWQPNAAEAELADFVSVVVADTEDTWQTLFAEQGKRYREPTLVLFSGATRSACGLGEAAMGPFYCPGDEKVYIDLAFYDQLRQSFGAPGDFAQAYVVAHEVGHHVQNLLGITQQVDLSRRRLNATQANALSVRLELQADCFAGVWARRAEQMRQILEAGDLEEALNAASAVGDDRLQRQARGHVTPDSFTHGSSAQRMRWFQTGFKQGRIAACDTFSAESL